MLVSMKVDKLVETEVVSKMPEPGFFAKLTGPPEKNNMFEDIKKRGILKVGYTPTALPFAFFNKKKELVGYDIQMAQKLAETMGCKEIKFLPFNYKDFPNALKYNMIDIAMSCISVTPERLHEVAFSTPYMEINIAFAVKGYMKDQYEKYDLIIKNLKGKTFALLKGSAYKNAMKAYFPEAKLVEIEDQKDFFEGKCKADALVTTAEQGSAWTLIYPHYKVAIPDKPAMKSLVAYAIPKGDPEFLNYINYCLEMSKINGYSKEQYSYWILGHSPEKKEPRWCIATNLLHLF
jgi:ABC-type amino acid transport substrate-binding protein